MTTLQEIGKQLVTLDNLVPIMLKSAEKWD